MVCVSQQQATVKPHDVLRVPKAGHATKSPSPEKQSKPKSTAVNALDQIREVLGGDSEMVKGVKEAVGIGVTIAAFHVEGEAPARRHKHHQR